MGGVKLKKVMVVFEEKCIGCGICELICSYQRVGEYNPKKSFIKILSNKEVNAFFPVIHICCTECGKCVEFCPTSALQLVTQSQAILLRKKKKVSIAPLIGDEINGEIIWMERKNSINKSKYR